MSIALALGAWEKELASKLLRTIAKEPGIEGNLNVAVAALMEAAITVAAMKASDPATTVALLRCIAEAKVAERVVSQP